MRQIPARLPRFCFLLAALAALVTGLAGFTGTGQGAPSRVPESDEAAGGAQTLGSIPGTFQVDQNGSAVYSMEIAVPPGTAGVAPSLSIGYNSHFGNSVLGQGWSLGGISFIQRCPVTRDGVSHPVTYTAADRFCLDGELLVAVEGEYGAPGTVYATELESWRKVVSNGTCGSGPCSFTATSRDGRLVSSFGATEDSRGEAVESCEEGRCSIPAGSVRAWGLDRVSDPYGNFVDYRFSEDSSTGEISPTLILYTGNQARGLPTQRAVELVYESRPDPRRKFSGGAIVDLTRLLVRLKTCVAEEAIGACSQSGGVPGFRRVSTYDLAYGQDPLTGLSRLESIGWTGADGVSYPPTSFEYGETAAAFGDPATWSTSYPQASWAWPYLRTMSDVNGDGRGDIVGFGRSTVSLSLSSWDGESGRPVFADVARQDLGFFTTDSGYSTPAANPRLTADVDGDGRGDIVGFGNTCVAVGLSLGDRFQAPQGSVSGCTGANVCAVDLVGTAWEKRQRQASDLDGDGRTDLIGFGETRTVLALSDGGCFGDQQEISAFSDRDGYREIDPRVLADVDGDGLADVVAFRDGGAVDVGLTRVAGGGVSFEKSLWTDRFLEPGRSSWDGRLPRTVVDVNGDGLADLVGFGDEVVIVALSTGKSFTSAEPWTDELTGFVSSNDLLTFGDVNGDGLADAVGFNTVKNRVVFGVSTGSSFDTDRIPPLQGFGTGSGYPDERDYPRFVGDVTGSGQVNVVGFGYSSVSVAVGPDVQPGRLVTVTDGLGGRIEVTYESISALGQGVYSPVPEGEPAGSPSPCPTCRPYQNNTLVVATHTVADDRGGRYSYRYSYAAAAWDSSGQGYLGFAERTVVDEQIARDASPPGAATVTSYHQAFPLTGMPRWVEVRRVADGLTLLEQGFEYCSALGEPCPGTPPPGVFVAGLAAEETVHHDELDESTYTTARRYTYDPYGNLLLSVDLGDLAVEDDDLTTCTHFENDLEGHHLGYAVEVIQGSACSVDSSSTRCSCADELTRSRMSYDGQWSLESRRSWDDVNGSWLGELSAYDPYGNLSEVRQAYWQGEDATPFQTSTTAYDGVYHTFPREVSNGLWSVEQIYDPAFGALVEQTDQNGLVHRTEIDGFGRPRALYGPDPAGSTVEIQRTRYDLEGGFVETATLTEWGSEIVSHHRRFLDGLGRTWRQAQQTSGGPDRLQDTEYDAEERVWRRSLPYFQGATPQWTLLRYDAFDRLAEVTLPTGERTTLVHDIEPLDGVMRDRSVRTDAVGTAASRTVTTFADAFGDVIERRYPGGSPGEDPAGAFHYDRLHRLREVTSPGGVLSTFRYDSLGRTVESTSSDTGGRAYHFDLEGNLAWSEDAEGQRIDYSYDPIGRPLSETAAAGPGFTFTYDEEGHGYAVGYLTTVSSIDADGLELSYDYGTDGLRSRSELAIDGYAFAQRMEHDPQGRLHRLLYPDGSEQRRNYTLAGYLEEISLCEADQDCSSTGFETYATYGDFTALGKPGSVIYGGATLAASLSYHTLGNLEAVRLGRDDGTTLLDRRYGWTPLHSLAEIEDRLDPARSRSMDYGAAGYLEAVRLGGEPTWSYGYDAAGNLTEKNGIVYDYEGQQVVRGTRGGETVFTAAYDANGDLERRTRREEDGTETTWELSFDPYRRLTEVERETVSASSVAVVADRFLYDDQGRLVKRESEDGTVTYYVSASYEAAVLGDGRGVVYTKYLDGPSGRVASVTVPAESLSSQLPSWPAAAGTLAALGESVTRGAGALGASGLALVLFALLLLPVALLVLRQLTGGGAAGRTAWVARTGWRALLVPGLIFAVLTLGAGEAFAALEPGENGPGVPQPGISFFFQDTVGSTALVTDRRGEVTAEVSYLPYGEVYQDASEGTDDFRAKLDGQEWIDASGLYFFSSRFYDPLTGRFVSADDRLLGGPDNSAAALNRYAFVENNPLTFADPSGHSVASTLAMLAVTAATAVASMVLGPGVALLEDAASAGAAAVNHSANPLDWDWKSWTTYGGMLAGIGITVAAVAVAAVVAVAMATGVGEAVTGVAAAVGIEAVGGFAVADIAAGAGELVGSVAAGSLSMAGANAAFTALGGGSVQDILRSAVQGATEGALIGALGFGVGAIGGEIAGSLTGVEVGAEDLASVEAEEVGELGAAAETDAVETGSEGCLFSFPAGTEVAVGHGLRPIEKISLADRVQAQDQGARRPASYPVTALYSRTAGELVEVRLAEAVIRATPEHPFRVSGEGWKAAGELAPGDRLESLGGARPMVLTVERLESQGTVFNLEVQTAHTYFVSDARVLVHNCGGKSKTQRTKARREQAGELRGAEGRAQDRRATHGQNWQQRDWRSHTQALGLQQFTKRTTTSTNKTIFENPQGHQIVVDRGARYWRHLSPSGEYLDASGRPSRLESSTHFSNQ